MGCFALNVPSLETSSAQIPSSVKAYKGNCPNCPCERAFVAERIPNISPEPITFTPVAGNEKGLLTSEVYILL